MLLEATTEGLRRKVFLRLLFLRIKTSESWLTLNGAASEEFDGRVVEAEGAEEEGFAVAEGFDFFLSPSKWGSSKDSLVLMGGEEARSCSFVF